MRRLLNLNHPSMIFTKVIGLFIVMIPAVLYGISLLLSRLGIIKTLLLGTIKVSFALGTFVLVVFLILMVAEQIQDHYLDAQYQKQRGQKISLTGGNYECQYCGNQRVQEPDKSCRVCGREFTVLKRK